MPVGSHRALALVQLCGAAGCALAQETIVFTLGWIEVVKGTTNPVPVPDGQLNPATESARIRVTFDLAPNPGGTAVWDTLGGTGQSGTVGGMGSILFDLVGDPEVVGTKSTFGKISRRTGFALGPAGTTSATGVSGAGAGQFILPGQTPLSDDNVIVYSVNWDPGSDVSPWLYWLPFPFRVQPIQATALLDVGIRDPEGNTLWVNDSWIPAPSGSAVAALTMGFLGGRRRRVLSG